MTFFSNEYHDSIPVELLDEYTNNIQKLSKFLKIFKGDLRSIEIDVKEEKDCYIIDKYFVYDNYRIHYEFESTGIKKLVTLFSAFKAFFDGKIVFIDELDSHIHDVYLLKLLEYFTEEGKGQLIFTTHNLAPMEVLKRQKHSIDFITSKPNIVSWKKSGNYSIINLYRKGMVENLPFNIESFDFTGLFDSEDDTNG